MTGNVLLQPEGMSSRLLRSKLLEVCSHRFGEPLRNYKPFIYPATFTINSCLEVTQRLASILPRETMASLSIEVVQIPARQVASESVSALRVFAPEQRCGPFSMIDVDIQAGVCSPTLPGFGLWGRALCATPSVLPMGVWNRNVLQQRKS